MRGCLTTIVFLLVSSSILTFILLSVFLLMYCIEPQAEHPFDVQWYTSVILLTYLIIVIKLMVKVSRAISNSICNFFFGKETE